MSCGGGCGGTCGGCRCGGGCGCWTMCNVAKAPGAGTSMADVQIAMAKVFLPLAGGTLTGPLTLAGAPVNPLDAATKAYADSRITQVLSLKPSVADKASLPTTGNTAGDVRQAKDTNLLYLWDGTQWSPMGKASTPIPQGTAAQDGWMLRWDSATATWMVLEPPKAVPDGVNDMDLLTWDAPAQAWVTAADELGDEVNVSLPTDGSADGGTFFYDDASNSFDVRKPRMEDLADGPGNAVAQDWDSLVWDATAQRWVPERLSLGDVGGVDLSGPVATNDGLVFDGSKWVPSAVAPRSEIVRLETQISSALTGLQHEVPVLAIRDDPPASPALEDMYIVRTGTGLWAGQNDSIARWDGAAWVFTRGRTGEAHLVEDTAETWTWNGASWVKVAAQQPQDSQWSVGSMQQSLLTEAQFAAALPAAQRSKWVLADGRNVAGTQYETITGSAMVPDLRGAYLRMAGVNASNSAWDGGALDSYQEDTTAMPDSPFVAATAGEHVHGGTSGNNPTNCWQSGTCSGDHYMWPTGNSRPAGAHTHSISGGDTETRPKTYSVNYFVKVD